MQYQYKKYCSRLFRWPHSRIWLHSKTKYQLVSGCKLHPMEHVNLPKCVGSPHIKGQFGAHKHSDPYWSYLIYSSLVVGFADRFALAGLAFFEVVTWPGFDGFVELLALAAAGALICLRRKWHGRWRDWVGGSHMYTWVVCFNELMGLALITKLFRATSDFVQSAQSLRISVWASGLHMRIDTYIIYKHPDVNPGLISYHL